MLQKEREALALYDKLEQRRRLTKGERRKLADAMGVPVCRVRNRWYRRDIKGRRADELAKEVIEALLKKSESHDWAT